MLNSFIARQPVFDKNVNIYGYELLYRTDAERNYFANVDPELASSNIMMESFHAIGLDKMTGGKRAFINFTEQLIEQGVATLFPKESLVVEVLEDVRPRPEILQAVEDLKRKGYAVALDDFEYTPEKQPLLDLCDIVKIDFLQTAPAQLKELISHVNLERTWLLAEKVESSEAFVRATNMGFKLFQGYFFCRPTIMVGKKVEPVKVNYLQLIKLVNAEVVDFDELSRIIRCDVALSYKLLRLVNSAYFGLRNKITDIKHALAMLGTNEIRKWVSLLSMTGLYVSKPDELVKMSMIRARFMERLGIECGHAGESEALFLTGLFSLIDALVEQPMEQIVEQVALPDSVAETLLHGKGAYTDFLRMIISFERGRWDEITQASAVMGVKEALVSDLYVDAVKWCNELMLTE